MGKGHQDSAVNVWEGGSASGVVGLPADLSCLPLLPKKEFYATWRE